jgi:hypothetical protein
MFNFKKPTTVEEAKAREKILCILINVYKFIDQYSPTLQQIKNHLRLLIL